MRANKSIIRDKSLDFSIRIVNPYKHLTEKKKEFIIAKQLLRSGTAIGALVREADYAESKPDFIHKFHIALKEASETEYWLVLLNKTEYLSDKEFSSLDNDINDICKILIAIIRTSKSKA